MLSTLDYTLTLSGCSHTFTSWNAILAQLQAHGDDGWVIVSKSDEAAYSKRVDLIPVAQLKPVDLSPSVFVLCQVAPLPQTSSATQ